MTVGAAVEERSLPGEIDRLCSATSDLIDLRKELIAGRVRIAPSRWDRLVESIAATGLGEGGKCVAGSRPTVWPDAAATHARKDSIQSALKQMPMLGQEWDTVRDGLLLRIVEESPPRIMRVASTSFLAWG